MTELTVIGDRILVRRLTGRETKTAGGIVMPSVSKEGGRDTQWCSVLAVGSGTLDGQGRRHAVEVTVGDEVACGYHVGWVVAEAEELLVICERDVVAVRRM
jgi:co-chaperonin GroES (HSP10)